MKKEILKIKINNKTVRIIHEGFKVSIYDQVVFGNKTKGFIPYNNFECSIDWNIV